MAGQYTADLLVNWGLIHPVNIFSDSGIDAVALGLLKENDVETLIPKIGDRVKFQANLRMWKEDNNASNVNRDHPPASVDPLNSSLDQVVVDLIDHNIDQQYLDLSGSEFAITPKLPVQPQPDRDAINFILEKTYRGRALLSSEGATKGILDPEQRRELAHLILDSVLEAKPDTILTWAQFQTWARGIGELFQLESPALYYTSYIPGNTFQPKRNASGILYYTYLRKRKNFIRKKIIPPLRKKRAASDTSDASSSEVETLRTFPIDLSILDTAETALVEEALNILRTAVEGATPWQAIENHWAETTKARLQQVYNKPGNLQDYLNEYSVLKGPNGYKLLIADFHRLYPETSDNALRLFLQNISRTVIQKARALLKSTKDQFLKRTITTLFSALDDNNSECTLNVTLLLLPLLLNITPQKGMGVARTSKAVVRDNFILQVPTVSDLEAKLADHRTTISAWKLTYQPLVVFIGESVTTIEKCLVIVEDTRYELSTAIDALDTAFKVFQATAAEYPVLAYDVWFLIQLAVYNIKTRYDRRISQSVRSLLVDLGRKEIC